MTPKLVIFDVDGTLIDSQAHIVGAMNAAFDAVGLPRPARAETLSIVGLSLPVAMGVLAPEHPDKGAALVEAYKDSFMTKREGGAVSPLYPGARAVLDALSARDDTILAIATGKSRRGLRHVLAQHDLAGYFLTMQVADDHPSKPHPSMIETCLRETGIDASAAAIIGDTRFDMEMGVAAGVRAIGVAWGYHPVAELHAAGAEQVLSHFDELPGAFYGAEGAVT